MYAISSARSVSAITSEPNAGGGARPGAGGAGGGGGGRAGGQGSFDGGRLGHARPYHNGVAVHAPFSRVKRSGTAFRRCECSSVAWVSAQVTSRMPPRATMTASPP